MMEFLYKKLIRPYSQNEDVFRREFILNILISGSTIMLLVATLVAIASYLSSEQPYRGMPVLLVGSTLILCSSLLALSRLGYLFAASILFICLHFFLATFLIFKWGVQLPPGLLFYVLIIVISGVLINSYFAFGVSAVSALAVFVVAFMQQARMITPALWWQQEVPEISDAAVLAIMFGIVSVVSWLSNRETEKSLARARRSEAELKNERDMLEIKVEQRTQELKKAQMEKMAQLYKFAEFGRLSSGFFHDLVNPLTAISLNLEQAKKTKGEENAATRSYLQSALSAAKRMGSFISAARKRMAGEGANCEFSVPEEITDVIQMISYKAIDCGVEISFHPQKDVKTFGDPIKFGQVLSNLVSNAIDSYLPIEEVSPEEKRRVEIEVAEKAGEII